MLLDVDGRTDTAARGKGRWATTKSNNPGNALTFSELGLAPAATHQGVLRSAAVGNHSRKHVTPAEEAPERRTGKRSVTVEHTSADPDLRKRNAGRYGIKKVTPITPQAARERQRAGATPSMTSEQRAVLTLKKAAAADPALAEVASRAVAAGGVTLLEAERQYKRQAEHAQRAEFQRAAEAAAKPRRFADPENLSRIQAPFGNNVAGVTNTVQYKPHRKQVPSPASNEHVHHGKRQVPTATGSSSAPADVPFDTSDRGTPYPAPPTPGVRVPLGAKHAAKRVIEAPSDGRDFDTVSAQRAATRHSRDAGGQPDFIFGSPPAPKARGVATPARHQPVGPSLLEHHSGPSGSSSAAAPRSRFAEVKYKKTALW